MTALERLRRLAEAATPGPWSVENDGDFDEATNAHFSWPWRVISPGKTEVVNLADSDNPRISEDAKLIVALRNAAPELLAVVEAAREECVDVDQWAAEELDEYTVPGVRRRIKLAKALRALDATGGGE